MYVVSLFVDVCRYLKTHLMCDAYRIAICTDVRTTSSLLIDLHLPNGAFLAYNQYNQYISLSSRLSITTWNYL
jgi:hypothetical protein